MRELYSRVDQFLKITRLIKSRKYAKEACEKGYVFLNGEKCKASKTVKLGDRVLLDFPLRQIELEVIKIPDKSVSGKIAKEFYKILRDEKKKI